MARRGTNKGGVSGGPKPPRNGSRRGRSAQGPKGGTSADEVVLYGLHAVEAALRNEARHALALHATEPAVERLSERFDLPQALAVNVVDTSAITRLTGPEAVHQGVALTCRPLDRLDESELFHLADARLVVVLDQITDPHNVGAILRSAVALDVDAVLTTARESARETGVLAKSASGALDMVRLVAVRNLSKALSELAAMRFSVIGLDSDGPDSLEATLERPVERVALVLGSEGKGLREKTREACTALARLDMPGAIRSLNVSNAAVLALYVARRALDRG